ncbi:MAG TPA: aminotransferase class V-fold PLP-dependent enzyme [Acidimicrobiales bacterium]|nr:aminotransferase class V-fold PLP-dependent enzyme [Acidimicrobiales bacterium]
MELPEHGLASDEIVAALAAKRTGDVRWQDGRTFGMVFDGGPDVHEVAEAAAAMFLHDNALNTSAFPSVAQIQAEVVEMCAALFNGGPDAAGFLTSGGTESILMAVKAARERGKAERGITEPEMVVARSAHAAFHKAAHYFGLRLHNVAVRDDWRADVGAMAACVNDNTVLVVGSAPQYPQGVIDDIPALAEVAAATGASFHTDACMGGFVLPFMERLGEPVPPWDFRVEGVTTISADLHKLGYAPKGVSVILHRTKELRRYQTFIFDDWLGGFYGSPNMQGSRSALPMACAWAVMHRLGMEGYLERTRATIDTTRRMTAAVRATDGLLVPGEPDAHILSIASAGDLDVFALGDALLARGGWFHDRQSPPDALHATVSAGNAPHVDAYVADLAACVDQVRGHRTADRSTNYATLE